MRELPFVIVRVCKDIVVLENQFLYCNKTLSNFVSFNCVKSIEATSTNNDHAAPTIASDVESYIPKSDTKIQH